MRPGRISILGIVAITGFPWLVAARAKQRKPVAVSSPTSQALTNLNGILLNNSPGAKITYTIYNISEAEKKPTVAATDSKKEHVFFWLGSRLPALLDLYREAWQMPEDRGRVLIATIEKMLDRNQLMLGLSIDMAKLFRNFASGGARDTQAAGRDVLMKMGEVMQRQSGSLNDWWTVGVGIGGAWNTARVGERQGMRKEAMLGCIRILRIVREALQAHIRGKSVWDSMLKLELGLQAGTASLAQVLAATPDWLVALESEILVGASSPGPVKTAERILDSAQSLAITLLNRYLTKHPDDYDAVFLKGKAAAMGIMAAGPSFDPLLPVNEPWELMDSLQRQIALRPDAPRTAEARKLLAIVAPVVEKSVARPEGEGQ